MSVKITWLGHACFRVEADGFAVIIDPYTGVPGYSELSETADMVLCSHGHGDHSYVQAVTLRQSGVPCPFEITKIDSFHDDCSGEKKGKNIIHVLDAHRVPDAHGVRIVHLGDLGHELDEQTLAALGVCHAVMAPVGGYYTIDAQTAKRVKDSLDCRAFIPMHYRTESGAGPAVLAKLDDFLALVDDARHYPDSTLEVNADTERQTAALKPV